jgi:hypothetical protein
VGGLVLLLVRPQSQEGGGRACWRLLLLVPDASQAQDGSLGVAGWCGGWHHEPAQSREEASRPLRLLCAVAPNLEAWGLPALLYCLLIYVEWSAHACAIAKAVQRTV